MSKRNTPIQKALEFTQNQIDIVDEVKEHNSHSPSVLHFLKQQREVLQSLLPYERECIEEAYKEGGEMEHWSTDTAQNYFNYTYNNPQGGGGNDTRFLQPLIPNKKKQPI